MPVKTNGELNGTYTNGVVTSPSANLRMEFNTDDPDYIKDLQRPAVIKEDLNEMERRKRVRQILESKTFREELEGLIITERQQGNNVDSLKTLEKLSELISPSSHCQMSSIFTSISNPPHAVVTIADLRGPDSTKYSVQERLCRNKLAALYRLIDLFQWSQGIYNHTTFRLNSQDEQILINPFGLLYHEITASSLVKIDFEGNVLDAGSTTLGINEAGYVLHTTIHRARRDLRCIIHLHTPVVVAVTAMKCGLLPISQDALMVGPVSYHDYQGILNDEHERQSIVDDLGPVNKVLILRNHGFVVCGASLEEAFLTLNRLVSACETQVRASRAGLENLIIPNEEAQKRMTESAHASTAARSSKNGVKWKIGELEWEAWMRVLDNAGFRTGHIYKQPVYRCKAPAAQSDVEIPPSATAYGLLEETDEADLAQRIAQIKRDQERSMWLNSPNVYQRVEFEETGTSEPKKLTKWVQEEASPAHSTSIKINSPHHFSPLAVNTKEFKDKQKAIKEIRRAENLSAGPQSKVFDGVTWKDAGQLKDAEMSGTQERVLIGAASKGIIEREFRHNAQIYRQLYQPNPFVSATDEDIQNYMTYVRHKQDGGAESVPRSESDNLNRVLQHNDGTESPESVSLMQAVRDFERQGQAVETTFDASTDRIVVSKVSPAKPPSNGGGWFRRSKSARYYPKRDKDEQAGSTTATLDDKALSDEDARASVSGSSPDKKEKKKKKFKTPSLFKSKKDKEKKK